MIESGATDLRLQAAIAGMQQLIRSSYPATTFEIGPGEAPGTTWMWARVDVEDPDEVVDLIIEPLLDLQIEQGILLDVIPVHTRERIEAMLREKGLVRNDALTAPV